MAKRSTKPAKNDRKLAIDRPFDPAVLKRAAAIARKYRIVLEPLDDGGYLGTSLEMPGVFGDGRTADECVKTVREALSVGVAYMLEIGEAPPMPADQQVRNKQVNIRLTEAEQIRLKEAATAQGFTDISDFIRTTTLRKQSA
jgi:predicted RNase H-like HicB family nuclease